MGLTGKERESQIKDRVAGIFAFRRKQQPLNWKTLHKRVEKLVLTFYEVGRLDERDNHADRMAGRVEIYD